ncbi:MAG: Lar family restriction alleviation protein [Neptuniibacter sp.]
MTELKACPWCNGSNLFFELSHVQPDDIYGGQIVCTDCDARGPDGTHWHKTTDDAEDDAVKQWNQRHIPEGYTLVPDEPTGEMIKEAIREQPVITSRYRIAGIYKAMLAAAKGDENG